MDAFKVDPELVKKFGAITGLIASLAASRASCAIGAFLLDRLGIVCGDRIAAMVDGASRRLTAGDFREVIDVEVQRSKAAMQDQIRRVIEGVAG